MGQIYHYVMALLLFCFIAGATPAQQSSNGDALDQSRPEITATYVIGEVSSVDPENNQIKLRIGKTIFTASIDEKTKYFRLKPGETKLSNAEAATLAEVTAGDRVMALGTVAAETKTVPARHVIVMKKDELAQKRQRDREAWRVRGIAGRISAINAQSKELTIQVRGPEGERAVTMNVSDKVLLRRYTPETIRFADTKPANFEELKVGDQIRALGEKSADGSQFTPEQIVSGSFRMIGGKVTAINAEANEITIKNLETERPVTIAVKDGSMLRRMTAEHVAMLRRAAPPAGARDPVDRLPEIPFSDLKQGDTVIISSAVGPNPSRANAIILVAGAEVLLNAAPAGQQRPANRGPNLSLGLPTGVFDGVISP